MLLSVSFLKSSLVFLYIYTCINSLTHPFSVTYLIIFFQMYVPIRCLVVTILTPTVWTSQAVPSVSVYLGTDASLAAPTAKNISQNVSHIINKSKCYQLNINKCFCDREMLILHCQLILNYTFNFRQPCRWGRGVPIFNCLQPCGRLGYRWRWQRRHGGRECVLYSLWIAAVVARHSETPHTGLSHSGGQQSRLLRRYIPAITYNISIQCINTDLFIDILLLAIWRCLIYFPYVLQSVLLVLRWELVWTWIAWPIPCVTPFSEF